MGTGLDGLRWGAEACGAALMDKVERLLNLIAALLETPRALGADEIHRRVPGYPEEPGPTFRRMFERDKDDLREMGIPLRVENVPGSDPPLDGYRIPRGEYYLRDPGLAPDELAALNLAASAIRLQGADGLGGLRKLGGVPSGSEDRPVRVAATELGELPADPNLAKVFQAVAERRQVRFDYRGEQRTLDPCRLDFQRGRWYVSGVDHLRGGERHFRLDRIEGSVSTGRPGAFERPATSVPGLDLAAWQLGEGTPVIAELLIDADRAALAEQQLGEESVTRRRADGSVVFSVPVTNRSGFRSLVVGFLDHAEVLGPPELRQDLVSWLRSMVP